MCDPGQISLYYKWAQSIKWNIIYWAPVVCKDWKYTGKQSCLQLVKEIDEHQRISGIKI